MTMGHQRGGVCVWMCDAPSDKQLFMAASKRGLCFSDTYCYDKLIHNDGRLCY